MELRQKLRNTSHKLVSTLARDTPRISPWGVLFSSIVFLA